MTEVANRRSLLLTSVAVLGSAFLVLPGHSAAPLPVSDATSLGATDPWIPAPLLDVPATVPPTPVASKAAVLPASVTPVALLAREIPRLPTVALAAYRVAAARQPACQLRWPILAGIGDIESGQAREHGSADPLWDGVARPPILGPRLDGAPFAAIADTDGGALDGDPVWDRAVGPMQFLPSTWRRYGVDMDHRGRADPENIRDAAAAAADYLCAAGGDLSSPGNLTTAIYAYNHSTTYVRQVLTAALSYEPSASASTALSQLPADPVVEPVAPSPVTALTSLSSTAGAVPIPRATLSPRPAVRPASSFSPAPLPAPTAVGLTPFPTPTGSPTPVPAPSASRNLATTR